MYLIIFRNSLFYKLELLKCREDSEMSGRYDDIYVNNLFLE